MGAQIVPKEEFLGFVGKKMEPGDWFELAQERIDSFAECTEDRQFIHIDPERAAQTPFGGPIAHGFLTLSMLSHIATQNGVAPENVVMGINYGFDKVRFLAPVRAGKRIRAHVEILDITAKDENRFLIKQGITVEIEGEDTPALVAEWLSMVVTG
jgi:acyl dehydratase